MIAHLAINNFWTQVETCRNPLLVKKPFVIAAGTTPQSPVIVPSFLAEKGGVFKGMSLYAAQKQLAGLAVVLPDLALYQRAQSALNRLAGRFSPLVETAPGAIFMDLSHSRYLYRAPQDAAAAFYKVVAHDLGLQGLLTMAGSRVTNQVAVKIARPAAPLFLGPGQDRPFMAPLPVALLPAIGRQRYERCQALAINTIGDLAALPELAARAAFGSCGPGLAKLAQGVDLQTLCCRGNQRQLACRFTLPVATNDMSQIEAGLRYLAVELARQMRRFDISAKSMQLQVTYSDWAVISRQFTSPGALFYENDLYRTAQKLLSGALSRRVAVSAVAISLRKLGYSHRQLSIDFADNNSRDAALQHAKDKIVDKFGAGILG